MDEKMIYAGVSYTGTMAKILRKGFKQEKELVKELVQKYTTPTKEIVGYKNVKFTN